VSVPTFSCLSFLPLVATCQGVKIFQPTRDMNKGLLILPLVFLVRQIDFEEASNLFYLRTAFATVVSLSLAVLYTIYSRIQSQADNVRFRITVPPPATPSWLPAAEPQAPKFMTVREYDYSELKKALQHVLLPVAIICFIHWKWAVCPPLFIQCFMMPFTLYSNPLFQIYVLGSSAEEEGDALRRPFVDKSSNPFAEFFPNNETPRGKKERKKERRNQERSEPGSDAKRGKKDSRSVRKAE